MDKKSKHKKREFSKVLFSWDAPEFAVRRNGFLWHVIILTLFILLVGYGFFSGAWSFSVALLVFAGVYAFVRVNGPRVRTVRISDTGVSFGAKFIPYENIRGFWVHEDPAFEKELFLELDRTFMPELSILLEDVDIVALRSHLSLHAEERKEKSRKLSDMLLHFLKL